MLEHVAAVAAEFRRESDQKMPETTKRALQENLSVTAQLKHLSDKTKELLKENDALRVREKQLKIENETVEPLLHEITRKNVSNQKVYLLYSHIYLIIYAFGWRNHNLCAANIALHSKNKGF